jgi:DNA-3-methyladenine glycosylase II
MKTTLPPHEYLRAHDPILGKVIDRVPPITLTYRSNYFQTLVESIIGQQLSEKAADTIITRFRGLFSDNDFPQPQEILALPDTAIRNVGISFSKISYIKDLARQTDSGVLNFEDINKMSDEEVIGHLTAVRGIGRWTAEMFLMFALGRPDVFSYGDLGLKNAIKKLYQLHDHPTEKEADRISAKWQPYRTLACRYLWKSLAP